jgi:hypothetical protein
MEAFCKGIQHLVQLKDVSRKIGEKEGIRTQNSELRSQESGVAGSWIPSVKGDLSVFMQ